eukprot:369268-Prymnesium_polylepis.2
MAHREIHRSFRCAHRPPDADRSPRGERARTQAPMRGRWSAQGQDADTRGGRPAAHPGVRPSEASNRTPVVLDLDTGPRSAARDLQLPTSRRSHHPR